MGVWSPRVLPWTLGTGGAPCGPVSITLARCSVRGASLAEDGRPGVDVNERTDATPTPESVAPVLRERIYGTVACLSTLLALVGHLDAETSAWSAVVDVAVANGSLWAASVFADVVAHITAHGRTPRAREALRTLRASGQILMAAAVPLLLLVVAGLDGMPLRTALQAGSWICVVTLGLLALPAARCTPLPGWERAVLVGTLAAAGVVVVKALAHG